MKSESSIIIAVRKFKDKLFCHRTERQAVSILYQLKGKISEVQWKKLFELWQMYFNPDVRPPRNDGYKWLSGDLARGIDIIIAEIELNAAIDKLKKAVA